MPVTCGVEPFVLVHALFSPPPAQLPAREQRRCLRPLHGWRRVRHFFSAPHLAFFHGPSKPTPLHAWTDPSPSRLCVGGVHSTARLQSTCPVFSPPLLPTIPLPHSSCAAHSCSTPALRCLHVRQAGNRLGRGEGRWEQVPADGRWVEAAWLMGKARAGPLILLQASDQCTRFVICTCAHLKLS